MTTATRPAPAAPRRGFRLNLWIGLAWVAIYLLLMWHSGWDWEGPGVLFFGTPKDASVERFGAPVPALVEAGQWQRIALSAWLHRNLLGLVLFVWFWASLGRNLVGLFGRARTWLIFLAGGVGGALTHVTAHAGSEVVGGAGPFHPVLAALGAQLLWALANKGPHASALLRSTVVSLLVIGVLTWYFTRNAPDDAATRALFGREAEIGAFGSGLLAMVLLGPRRANAAAGGVVRGLAFVGLAVVVLAAAVQAPKVWASARRDAAAAFLAQLGQTEYEAWHIAQSLRHATVEKRNALEIRLGRIEHHTFLDGYEGADAMRAYVEALRAWTRPDVPMPWETEAACRRAFRAWYERFEKPLREDMGLPARSKVRHFWEPR